MTKPRKTPAEPQTSRGATMPLIPAPRPGDKDLAEMNEPYDPPFPDDRWPRRPEYVIVADQLRGWQPGRPASLAELLEAGHNRTREPEPALEAEP